MYLKKDGFFLRNQSFSRLTNNFFLKKLVDCENELTFLKKKIHLFKVQLKLKFWVPYQPTMGSKPHQEIMFSKVSSVMISEYQWYTIPTQIFAGIGINKIKEFFLESESEILKKLEDYRYCRWLSILSIPSILSKLSIVSKPSTVLNHWK